MDKEIRIQFGPRDFVKLTDPDEEKALVDNVVIHLRHESPTMRLYYGGAPWVDRNSVEYFVRGWRAAHGKSLEDQQRGFVAGL